MKFAPSLFGRALALSLILHAALFAVGAQFAAMLSRNVPPAQAELKVSLRKPQAAPAAPVVPLQLPQAPPRDAIAAVPRRESRPRLEAPGPEARPAAAQPGSLPRLEGEAALRAAEQLRRELAYPPEAIERGLQGEALVLLFLDASGNAIAARLESSSGHALLDDAALRAARTLHSLPGSAPREVLLPVRFRLR